MLNFDSVDDVMGKNIQKVIPGNDLLSVVRTGDARYDEDAWVNGKNVVMNQIPVVQDHTVSGVVMSFRLKDELEKITRQFQDLKQYSDTLRSQAHEYSNKLHTIAGLIQIEAKQEALELIGQESSDHQAFHGGVFDYILKPLVYERFADTMQKFSSHLQKLAGLQDLEQSTYTAEEAAGVIGVTG